MYERFKQIGARFPPFEDIPIFVMPQISGVQNTHITIEDESNLDSEIDEYEKLRKDLLEVRSKVKLCREMLLAFDGVERDEILSDVIGFLEVCKPRMVELIEAGMHGVLGEDLFELCLKVNDELLKTLEAEMKGVPITTENLMPKEISNSVPINFEENEK